jgi:mercuric ion transport protein
MTLGKILFSGIGGLAASFASMLCCTGPLLMASIGLSGAGLSVFRPYRWIFLIITAVFLYLAYHLMDKEEQRACEPDEPCADPRTRKRTKRMLWVMTGIALVFATSPRWAGWVFG